MFGKFFHLAGEFVGFPEVVSVEEGDPLRLYLTDAEIARGTKLGVGDADHSHRSRESGRNGCGVVS